jgi:hypothetical protein
MWFEVFSFSNRRKGSFLSDRKQRFRAVSTGSGPIWRRSKMRCEKLMKFQEKPVNTGVLRGIFEGQGVKIGLRGTI